MSQLSKVWIQKQDGEFVSPSGCAAFHGFKARDFSIEFFEWPPMRDGHIRIDSDAIYVGGAGTIAHIMHKLAVILPAIDDHPTELHHLLGRNVWRTVMGAVRTAFQQQATPIFIKPYRDPKYFAGTIVKAFRDLIPTAHVPDEKPILASDVVSFVSEWRMYILEGKVIGASCYSGDPLLFPDRAVLERALRDWPGMPAGCAIDLGVTDERRTLLVEVNDGYSLGSLGLRPVIYSRLLEARSRELTAAS